MFKANIEEVKFVISIGDRGGERWSRSDGFLNQN